MTEAMVIDTNVLEHAFDPTMNRDGHVERLLRKFSEQKRKLCIDRAAPTQKSRIIAEYQHRLQYHLHALEERGQLSQWLRYLTVLAERVDITVNLADALGVQIVQQMKPVGAEVSDRIFVYVACKLDSVMVSNNHRHVTDLRSELIKAARKIRSKNTDFLSSAEAEATM